MLAAIFLCGLMLPASAHAATFGNVEFCNKEFPVTVPVTFHNVKNHRAYRTLLIERDGGEDSTWAEAYYKRIVLPARSDVTIHISHPTGERLEITFRDKIRYNEFNNMAARCTV